MELLPMSMFVTGPLIVAMAIVAFGDQPTSLFVLPLITFAMACGSMTSRVSSQRNEPRTTDW